MHHGFFPVDRDLGLAEVGEKSLRENAAGEIIFNNDCFHYVVAFTAVFAAVRPEPVISAEILSGLPRAARGTDDSTPPCDY